MTMRIAVLASGGGSNLQAIMDHQERLGDATPFEVALVASDRADARALSRARNRGIATATIATGNRGGDSALPLDTILATAEVGLVVLAGYLRLVPASVVARLAGRIINIHPALLPAFGGPGMYGARVHRAVLESGATVSGATVHFVDEDYDRGTIIAQWPVPVIAGDDAAALAARVLRVEHALLPRVVEGMASGAITLERCRARPGLDATAGSAFTLSMPDDETLTREIDRAFTR